MWHILIVARHVIVAMYPCSVVAAGLQTTTVRRRVNNGEIFLAEACVKLLKGDHEDEEEEEEACAAVEKAVHRNARLPFTVYLQSVCKNLKKNKKDKEEFDRSRVVLTKLASKTRSWMVSMLARAQQNPVW